MTLVVGRLINDEVYVLGDTRFTTHEGKGWSEAKQYIGGLKVVLLAPGLCVAFSGNTEIVRDAIEGFYDKGINAFDKNDAINHFLNHHRLSLRLGPDAETDFIVAVIVESDNPPGGFEKEIFRIAESGVHWEKGGTHIGDTEAFNCFQEAFHNGVRKSYVPTFEVCRLGASERPGFDASLAGAMHAMQAVIDDPSIPTVDGIRTVVASEEHQFRYIEYVQVRGIPVSVRRDAGASVSFGGAERGSDVKHVAMLSAIGCGVFPVYSMSGQFGLIYQPERKFEPTVCTDCTFEEFREMVEQRISEAHQRALAYQRLV